MKTSMKNDLSSELLEKYSVSVPRYTSYPTAPEWKESFTKEDFLTATKKGNENKSPISLYFHLPFCESQCYFCACNVVISKKRDVVDPYIDHLKKEIANTAKYIDKERVVEQVHLGGGTPTYFTPSELKDFFSSVSENFTFSKDLEAGVEVDPRVTTKEHLKALSALGFNRISMGIQDFDIKVQEAVNRVQPYEQTKKLFDDARELGFHSINVDLIYGLPYQTQESFSKTIDLIIKLNPDRIALFHYAHLPMMVPHQGKYIDSTVLPDSSEKIKIFQHALKQLNDNGYAFIGLDHFAKPDDELSVAKKNRTLHRNFQGYTTKAGCDLYGFGITSISSIQNTFSQNIKKVNPYYEKIEVSEIPVFRGFTLNNDDLLRREVIMKILCDGEVNKKDIEKKYNIDFNKYFLSEIENLKEFEDEGLVVNDMNIIVTSLGQFFLRNIASTFDFYLQEAKKKNEKGKIYSKSV